MDLRQYLRVLHAHWLLIAAAVAISIALAGSLAWTRPPTYAAEMQLYVSSLLPEGRASSTESYAAALLSQQRAVSYAQLVASPPIAEIVDEQLALSLSPAEFRSKVSAVRPAGTVLIDVTVRDRSPELAQAIAGAIGEQFPSFIDALETTRTEGSSPVKVSVTSPPELPTSPIAPRKTVYLVLGTLLGLGLGVGGAVIREAFTKRVRNAEDASALTGLPVLGSIAEHRQGRRRSLVVALEPTSPRAEEYRRVRTNLLPLIEGRSIRSFVVTSASASEGKTLTTANLGIAFAQAGHRVVLVDADLRRSALAEAMGLSPFFGLADMLTSGLRAESALQTWREGLPLDVLPAGPHPDNPSELLAGPRFAEVLDHLTSRADIVILDTPALLPTSDAAILARSTAGAVVVVRAGSTRADHLIGAVESLYSVEASLLGLVVNGLPPRSAARRYGGAYVREPSSDRLALPSSMHLHVPERESQQRPPQR